MKGHPRNALAERERYVKRCTTKVAQRGGTGKQPRRDRTPQRTVKVWSSIAWIELSATEMKKPSTL
jgi:hypothetical protein